MDQRLDALGIELALAVTILPHAPIVDGDREIVGERIGRGKTEVDDAGDAAVDKEYVVAEQVAMDRSTRQSRFRETGLALELAGKERVLFRREQPANGARRLPPPGGSAPIGESPPVLPGRDVQFRQRAAYGSAVRPVRPLARRTSQPLDQPGRLAVTETKDRPGTVTFRRGRR